jgi:hypothetical protein
MGVCQGPCLPYCSEGKFQYLVFGIILGILVSYYFLVMNRSKPILGRRGQRLGQRILLKSVKNAYI